MLWYNSTMLTDFLVWHFGAVPEWLLKVWRGALIFTAHFFAIGYHLATFFKPWHRQYQRRGRGFDFKEWGGVFVFNSVGRVIGMAFRTLLIFWGGLTLVVIGVGGLMLIAVWVVLPLLALALIIQGAFNLF